MDTNNKIFRLNDDISFRVCSLHEGDDDTPGDCTNFYSYQANWKTHYSCNQYGIHLHCTKHPPIELNITEPEETDHFSTEEYVHLTCPKCRNDIKVSDLKDIYMKCKKLLNMEKFKNATLIRLDDWYIPELKGKVDNLPSDYWIKADVKTDKDNDTIVVLYIGNKSDSSKVQYFIKPEKCQLTSDHKDTDPAKVIARIDVTLKDRKLSHSFDTD